MSVSEIANSCLPVVVRGYETNDPMFAIFGEDSSWALAISCQWTINGPDVEYRWDGGSLERAVKELIGATLVRIEIADDLVDPVFHFDNQVQLAVHADTDLDPWVLRLPGMEFVLVGLAK